MEYKGIIAGVFARKYELEEIRKKYKEKCRKKSDINEHLPTLFKYARRSDHVTEMGVRSVVSTWAFLFANPRTLVSYDILKNTGVDEAVILSKRYNVNFNFIEADVLKIEIENTDLLFIDTLHTYAQLTQELNLHAQKVDKYIILHDIETFAYQDEKIYYHASEITKAYKSNKAGLVRAVNDFLKTPSGAHWKIHKLFKNNNGLLILKRTAREGKQPME